MGQIHSIKPRRETFRVNTPRMKDLYDAVRYHGTHVMRNEFNWIREMAIQTAAKSFKTRELADNQENFLRRMQDMRYVNGFNDVEEIDFSTITQLWHDVVMQIVDDFNDVDVFDFDESREVMEINVAKITEHHIDLERLLYKRA